ncbi:MAG: glycosyltransferase [Rubrobacter sp.]|nr:glycosyltransferase [Rubrobacter sp.]
MIGRIKVVDVELDAPPIPLESLEGYGGLRALVRLHGTPIGFVELPLSDAGFTAEDLRRIILRRLAEPIVRDHLRDMVESPLPPDGVGVEELPYVSHPVSGGESPLITAAVCTRDRPEDLKLCLDSLVRLDYPRLEILVVDNAPKSDATQRLIGDFYPRVRYVCEPRPGLDWARNRAIVEARGEIIAYTDDDVIVDPGWATALAEAFRDPEVMAVTGLVVPYELETEAQVLFERYGGFGRGYKRKYWRIDLEGCERALEYLGTGRHGTGANMAYRCDLFQRIGAFDPALDVGTVTNGGGDLEMLFRVLKEGYLLAYEPAALVRHRHRREYAQLRTQLTNNGIGFYSYLVRTAMKYPDIRGGILRFGMWWIWWWNLRRLVKSFIRPSLFPHDLIWAELRGSFVGLGRYSKARRRAAQISSYGDGAPTLPSKLAPSKKTATENGTSVGVRMVDLCQPLRVLDVAANAAVRIFVTFDGRPIGSVTITNRHQPVSAARLREAIVDDLGLRLLGQDPKLSTDALQESARVALHRRYLAETDGADGRSARLDDEIPVSVIVATYDRPDDLRYCLRHLSAQESARPVEVVVVDNHPASGLTPPVIAEFPGVVLVTETRKGLSYARNKGFTTSRGEIVVATDDDVLAPPDWLERLVAPFARSDVMVVTGNTFPADLETAAQQRFERYGGLGRGFVPREADIAWFKSFRRRAVPTWDLGATANAAFRASAFAEPEIGLMDEVLGAGTPTGCSEDTDFFYKVLRAGYTIQYEPSACVWHKHRRDERALRSQLYNYSKGHVAYHLMTLLRDRDPRAVWELTFRLPRWHLKRIISYAKRRLLGRSHYPLKLTLLEIGGNLAGPFCLWRSYRRVKRDGRSDPYVRSPRQDDSQDKPLSTYAR